MSIFVLGDKKYTQSELIRILDKSSYRNCGVKHFAKALKNAPLAELSLNETTQTFTLRRDGVQDIYLRWPLLNAERKTLTAARVKHAVKMKLNFFNYRANHLDRMGHLANAIMGLQKKKRKALEDSSSESASVLEKKASSIPLKKDYLKVFKEILNKAGIIHTLVTEVTPPESVSIYYDKEKFTFYIQPEHNVSASLGLVVNQDHTIVCLELNGKPLDSLEVPEKCLPYLRACCNKFFESSSQYQEGVNRLDKSPVILASLIEDGVEAIPEYHLDRLTTIMGSLSKKQASIQVFIKLINSSLTFEEAIDAGAITNEIFEKIVASLLKSRHVSFQKQGSLHFPIAAKSDHAKLPLSEDETIEAKAVFASLNEETKTIFGEKGQRKKGFLTSIWDVKAYPFSSLNPMEKRIFRQLGQLSMFCYHSKQNYSIGCAFDDSLFAAISSLNAAEIDGELTPAVFKKMAEAVIDALYIKHPTVIEFQWLKIAIQLLEWQPGDKAPEDAYLRNAWQLFGLCDQGNAFLYFAADEFTSDLNLERVKDPLHLGRFMALATHAVLTADLKVCPRLADYVPVIFEIAKGGKMQCAPGLGDLNAVWDAKFHRGSYTEFNQKVQGSQDRALIVDLIHPGLAPRDLLHAKELIKKMNWIKEWILNEATDEEIAAFLKYTSGSSTVKPGSRILIVSQNKGAYNPVPEGHACFAFLAVSPKPVGDHVTHDRNKTAFINNLKNHCLIKGGGGFTTEWTQP